MTVLLDTSVMIDALRRRRGRRDWLRTLLLQGDELACCAVSVAEIYSGMRPQESDTTREFIDSLQYIDISLDAARQAGELRLEWQRRGKTLSLPDALIGAVALHEDLALATDNVKHFSMLRVNLLSLPKV